MNIRLYFYGGVEGQIGGNLILLLTGNDGLIYDFGVNFKLRKMFFEYPYVTPRSLNDLIVTGNVPDLPIYTTSHNVPVSYAFISHAHVDHCGYVPLLNKSIKVYMGYMAYTIVKSKNEIRLRKTFENDFQNVNVEVFHSGREIDTSLGTIIPVHVDHSIPGSYGFISILGKKTLAYTGDFRLHGTKGYLTKDFIELATREGVTDLIIEATNTVLSHITSEKEVMEKLFQVFSESKGLIILDYSESDVDRFKSIYKAAVKAGRKVVLSPRQAYLLYMMIKQEQEFSWTKLDLPSLDDKNIMVYNSGRSRNKALKFLLKVLDQDKFVTNVELIKEPEVYVFSANFYNIEDIKSIDPPPGSVYILSSSEPFDEERELRFEKLINWLDVLGIPMYHIHASGHASPLEIRMVVEEINPEKVYIVHSENPMLMAKYLGNIAKCIAPIRGKEYIL